MKKDFSKYLLGFLLGSLIFGTLGVLASSNYVGESTSITYDNSNSGLEVSNVQEAVDTIVEKTNYGDATNSDIKEGKKALSSSEKLIGSMPDNGTLNYNLNPGETDTIPFGYTSGGTISVNQNINNDTYSFSENSLGSTTDLGVNNSYRYIDATNVYNKGVTDGGTLLAASALLTSTTNKAASVTNATIGKKYVVVQTTGWESGGGNKSHSANINGCDQQVQLINNQAQVNSTAFNYIGVHAISCIATSNTITASFSSWGGTNYGYRIMIFEV